MNTNTDAISKYFVTLFGDDPKCELNFGNDIQCLVAIILSAQCTDKRVNTVTKTLFQKYKAVTDFADADQSTFESEIHSLGFYHSKTKNIIAMANAVLQNHGGVIPIDLIALTNLPGVGRKTASVFLAEFHKIPAIGVDTHVIRVSNRLGLTTHSDPAKIELDLKNIVPEKDWCRFSLSMVLFGRYNCTAKNPKCEKCGLKNICVFCRI